MATEKDELGVDVDRSINRGTRSTLKTREQRIIDTAFFWISFLFCGRDFVVWERQTIAIASSTMEVYWRDGQKWARLSLAREGEASRPAYVVRLLGKEF